MIPIFIGYDRRETVAWHVLAASLIRGSSEPLALTPIGNNVLPPAVWWRGKGPFDSTEFSNARFLVPHLMEFDGWAIFMDADMLATDDIVELWNQRDDRYAVMLRKHDYRPKALKKFLGEKQTSYERKNWSSLMLLNCGHPACARLTSEYVNDAPGLDLHQFKWCPDAAIGEVVGPWNVLVLHADDPKLELVAKPSLVHFTEGGPWHGYTAQPFARAWARALASMLTDNNPAAVPLSLMPPPSEDLDFGVTYRTPR